VMEKCIKVHVKDHPEIENSLRLENGNLNLTTLQSAFPFANRLIFSRDGKLKMLLPSKGIFFPPRDGWDGKNYFVEMKKNPEINAPKDEGVIVPGEERWNLLQPWDEIKVEKKIRDYFSSSKNNNTDDLTPSTSLLTEMLHLDPNENFENLYGIYDKIWEKEPINSLFLRMDAAIDKRKIKLEEAKKTSDPRGSYVEKFTREKYSKYDTSPVRKRRRSRSRDRSGYRSRSRERSRRRSRSRKRERSRSRKKDKPLETVSHTKSAAKDDGGDVQIVGERNKADEVHEIFDLTSSDEEEKERRRRRRDESDARCIMKRRREESADRRRKKYEEEESRTRAQRQFYAEERRKLREERKKVEKEIKEQREQEKWLKDSDNFLKKLGIDSIGLQPEDACSRASYSPPRHSINPGYQYEVRHNSSARHSNSPDRLISDNNRRDDNLFGNHSPESFSRYAHAEDGPPSHDPTSRFSPKPNNLSRYYSQDSHYPEVGHDGVIFSSAGDDRDLRNRIQNGGIRSTEYGGTDGFRDSEPMKFENSTLHARTSVSPEIEVEFGKSFSEISANSSSSVQTPNTLGQDKLRPGNYLTITLDIVTLGTGVSTELYQLGAYSMHGESFVRCVLPLNFQGEAENHPNLPMVKFKKKCHVNNRQTGNMEECISENTTLKQLVEFITRNINRVRPPYDGAVLVCHSNFAIASFLRFIGSSNVAEVFWHRVHAIGSLQELVKNHPNGDVFLRGENLSPEEMYYQLFKSLVPMEKLFSDVRAKYLYEILVKFLDTNPGYLNFFKDHTFTRYSRGMEKIKNPTFFLNKWETYAPLRLFVIRSLKAERVGMLEEDLRYLPQVADISKKMCRNLIEAGFAFEEILELAKTRGLSATELELRSVLLRRMAGQSRTIIDTAIQSTKLIIAFLVQNGHKSLGELLEEVRTSKELSSEYMDPLPEGSSFSSETGANSNLQSLKMARYDPAPSSSGPISSFVAAAPIKTQDGLAYEDLDDSEKPLIDAVRRHFVSKVLAQSGRPWKSNDYHRCVAVILKAGLTVSKLITLSKTPGAIEEELRLRMKPIFNKEGPAMISYENFRIMLTNFIEKDGEVLNNRKQLAQVKLQLQKQSKKGMPFYKN